PCPWMVPTPPRRLINGLTVGRGRGGACPKVPNWAAAKFRPTLPQRVRIASDLIISRFMSVSPRIRDGRRRLRGKSATRSRQTQDGGQIMFTNVNNDTKCVHQPRHERGVRQISKAVWRRGLQQ